MSFRFPIKPFQVVKNASMSGTSVITSTVSIIQQTPIVSYSVVWTGTPNGTFSVEVSNDYALSSDGVSVLVPGTWTPLVLTGQSPVATGSAGNGFIDIDITGAYAIRLVYTNASGSGVLNATICGKNT